MIQLIAKLAVDFAPVVILIIGVLLYLITWYLIRLNLKMESMRKALNDTLNAMKLILQEDVKFKQTMMALAKKGKK